MCEMDTFSGNHTNNLYKAALQILININHVGKTLENTGGSLGHVIS